MLLGCYRTGDANDPEIYVRAATAVLGDYPMDVVHTVCDPRRGIPSKSKWLPTVAEIKEACEEEMVPVRRREHEARLAEEHRARLAAPVDRVSIEELRAKHGDDWGLSAEGKARPETASLEDLCRAAGVSREEFEAANEKAVAALPPAFRREYEVRRAREYGK